MKKRGLPTQKKKMGIFLSLVLCTLIISMLLAPFSLCCAQENGKINETKQPQDSGHKASFSLLELAIMNSMTYILVIPNAGLLGFSPAKLAILGSYFYLVSTPQKAQMPHSDSNAEPVRSSPNPTSESHYIICCSNEKNIGTALELYATDNNLQYPDKLEKLTPEYLVSMPTCPATGKDTYSSSYRVSAKKDEYSFCCKGSNHSDVGFGANIPRYSSTEGLIYK